LGESRLLELMRAAHSVARRAHSPYSGIQVGAALACADGSVVRACNVESASYGLTQCAERAAVTAAIALGKRDFVALAIWASTPRVLMPCGACRQVLAEHAPHLALESAAGWDVRRRRPRHVERSQLARLLPRAVGARDVLER
jgi:cytidine deaminase